ncbi:MAG TPA: hypothetical protein VF993_15215 [Myxococcales bacterium]
MNRLATALALALAACGGSSRPDPTIAIISPVAGATVTMATNADKTVSLTYTLTNFTVMLVGQCSGVAGLCGHIHVLIDGTTCNDLNGDGYNNSSYSSSQALARFALCPAPAASHTVELQLHDDVHNPVNNNAGQQVKASVAIITQ